MGQSGFHPMCQSFPEEGYFIYWSTSASNLQHSGTRVKCWPLKLTILHQMPAKQRAVMRFSEASPKGVFNHCFWSWSSSYSGHGGSCLALPDCELFILTMASRANSQKQLPPTARQKPLGDDALGRRAECEASWVGKGNFGGHPSTSRTAI